MDRKSAVKGFEKGKFVALKDQGLFDRAIAKKLKRFLGVLLTSYRLKGDYGAKKSLGYPPKLQKMEKNNH